MQKNRVLKVLFLSVMAGVIVISTLGIQIRAKEAYASDNDLIEMVNQIIQGQEEIRLEITQIKDDIKEIKSKVEALEKSKNG